MNKKELLNKRVYAYLIDIIVIQVLNLALKFTFMNFLITSIPFIPLKMQIHASQMINFYSSFTMLMIGFAYMTLFTYLNHGKTFGKYLIGLQTINKDNSPLTFKQAAIRSFGNCLSMMLGSLPFLFAYIHKEQRTMADFMAGTTVVSELKIHKEDLNLILLSGSNQVCSDEIYHEDVA